MEPVRDKTAPDVQPVIPNEGFKTPEDMSPAELRSALVDDAIDIMERYCGAIRNPDKHDALDFLGFLENVVQITQLANKYLHDETFIGGVISAAFHKAAGIKMGTPATEMEPEEVLERLRVQP